MIIDLLTIPQGHKFYHRVDILRVSRSAHHPLQFDMPHDHVWNEIKILTPKQPQIPPSGVFIYIIQYFKRVAYMTQAIK